MTDINPKILKEEEVTDDLAEIKNQIDTITLERETHAQNARQEMAEMSTCDINLKILRDKASVILGIKSAKVDRSEGKTPRTEDKKPDTEKTP